MMKTRELILVTTIFLCAGNSKAQDSQSHRSAFPVGLSIEYGLGKYSVRDEYLSNEKYSGTLPYFKTNWSRFHSNYIYFLDLEFHNSSKIDNYNVSAEISQFALKHGFLYPLPQMSLFNKKIDVFLGPTTELNVYTNKQDVAVFGVDDNWESAAVLFSLGLNSTFILPVRQNLQLEASVGLSILSLGLRSVDDEDDVSSFKFLTLFSGMNTSLGLGIRYYLLEKVSLKIAYGLQVARVTAWDHLVSASDNLAVTFTYGL